jgi:hypothetical protein
VDTVTLYALRPDSATGSLEDAEVVDELLTGVDEAIVAAGIVDKSLARSGRPARGACR